MNALFYCCLAAFLLIFLVFFLAVQRVKAKSTDKKLATYYYELASKEPHKPYVFNAIDTIPLCITFWFCIIVVSLFFVGQSVEFDVIHNFVFTTDWDAWFKTLIVDICIPVLLATIASLGLFYTLVKRQFVFYSTHDVLTAWKIPNKMLSGAIWLALSLLTVFCYYVTYFSESSDYRTVLLPANALTATAGIFIVLCYCSYILWRTVEFLFRGSTNYKLLDRLYTRAHQAIRQNGENIAISNTDRIEFYLKYMLSKVPNRNIQNEKIKFVCYLDNMKLIPGKAITSIVIKFSCFVGFLAVVLGLAFCLVFSNKSDSTFLNTQDQLDLLWQILIEFVGAIFLTLLLCLNREIRKIAVKCFLGSWGFVTGSEDSKCFSIHYSQMFSVGSMSKGLSTQLQGYYNIISAFRDTISVDQEVADLFLRILYKNIDKNSCGTLLFTSCLCLYKERFGTTQAHIGSFCNLLQLPDIDKEKLRGNTEAIVHDILRKEADKLVNQLFEEVSNPTVCCSEKRAETGVKQHSKKSAKKCKMCKRINKFTFQFFKI